MRPPVTKEDLNRPERSIVVSRGNLVIGGTKGKEGVKTREVKPIHRSANNFGPIQLWVSPKGRLFTFGADNPKFKWASSQEMVLVKAEDYRNLLNQLWEQRYLIHCA